MTTDALTVVFTGLLRQPDRFRRTLALLNDAKRDGYVHRLLVSTWEGEWVDTRAALGSQAAAVDDVVESPKLNDNGPGNIYAQKLHLQRALDRLPDQAWVLKTRTDVGLGRHILPWLADKVGTETFRSRPWRLNGDWPMHRLWVPWFHAGIPFGLADEAICGTGEDLSRLNVADQEIDRFFDTADGFLILLSTHVRRFLPIFRDTSVAIWDFLKLLGEPKLGTEATVGDRLWYRRFRRDTRFPFAAHRHIVESLVTDDDFHRILARHYDLLSRFFVWHNPAGEVIFAPGSSWPLVDPNKPFAASTMGRSYLDDTWLELVCSGSIPGSELVAAEVSDIERDPERLRVGLAAETQHRFREAIRQSIFTKFLPPRRIPGVSRPPVNAGSTPA